MKKCGIQSIPLAIACLLLGCSHYQPKPLTDEAVQQQLQTPTVQQLTSQAAQIKHPLLKPVSFNLQDGLSPDEAAILAVLRNPELRAARDKHGIANAQLLQAGLLPNPILSYNFAALNGGLDQGKVTGFGLGLTWEITSLITQSNKITAAEAEQQAVDLQIAWQEWQIAQAAKTAVYKLLAYAKQQQLLEEMVQRLENNRALLQVAADKGLVTELERVAAINAKNGVDIRLQALVLQKNQQQQRLNRALGLKPDEAIKLEQNLVLTDKWVAPSYVKLTHDLTNRRLDLIALQQAYKNQDEQVRIAVLQQFPSISIGFTQTKNNSDYYTLGAGVTVTLPIFDQNQGKIALAEATRQQLFDEYTNRVFRSNSDIAELLATITPLNQQIESVRRAIPDLESLVNTYKQAIEIGQADVLTYYMAWNNCTDKKIELLSLQLQLDEARIALDIATGSYHLQV
jgi:cobalt-zinc-cadmium efflux system outer membrane protein